MSTMPNINDAMNSQAVQALTAANPNNSSPQSGGSSATQKEPTQTQVAADEFVKSSGETKQAPTYSRPATVKPDLDKINEFKADLQNNMGAFRMMVERMNSQDGNRTNPFSDPTNTQQLRDWVAGVASGRITYDAATIDEAKQLISEDGYWGVEAVSDRIVGFAKAISGGDINQYDKLLKAIKGGFGQAESAWGGKMPDITKQTYDRTMEKMETWKNEATSSTTTPDAVRPVGGGV